MQVYSNVLRAHFPEGALEAMDFVDCPGGCGERILSEDEICLPCERKREHAEESERPKGEALMLCGVPPRYRESKGWLEEAWPVAWPGNRDLRNWTGKPWCVVMAGVNGSGKSHRAAELLYRAWRRGERPAGWPHRRGGSCWVTEQELVAGIARFGQRNDVLEAAKRQPYLVYDELGSMQGLAAQAWDQVRDLIEYRYSHRYPTIICTNLAGTAQRAGFLRAPGSSIEERCSAVFNRLLEGLWLPWQEVSFRGAEPQEFPDA